MQIIILRNTKVVVACLVLVACHADNAGEMSNAPGPAMLAGDYYVAPDGSDANAGTLSSPWKSVTQALQVIGAGRSLPSGGITVWVRGGTYYVEETIVLSSKHSGTSDSPVTIKAYPGEEPIFIGGRPVSGWTLDSGNVYKAYLGDVDEGEWRFDQLFENGIRQTKARYPNSGYLRSGDPTDELYVQFTFKPGELPAWSNYKGAQASIWAYANWFENIVPIADIDFETRVITLSGKMQQINIPADRYFQQIIAPVVVRVFDFRGESPDNKVEHISLEGLTIWGSKFTDFYGHGGSIEGPAKSVNRPGKEHREGIIRLENASHISVKNSTIYNTGYSAVAMGFYASHNTVAGNNISDCGFHGILMVGRDSGDGVVNDPSEQIYDNKFNTIYNNHIHHCGRLAGDAGGVYLYQSGDNDIAHNRIHNMPRYGIAMKGHASLRRDYPGFGNVPITDENYWDFYTGRNNKIRFNHVHDLLEDSYDAGGISLRRSGLNNVIDNNRIHSINPPATMDRLFPFGIYLDGGTSNTTMTNNVIYDIGTGRDGYAIKMKKRANSVINNILVLEAGRNGVLAMQRGGAPEPKGLGYGDHVVTNNILYAKGENPVIYWFKSEDEFHCGLVEVSEDNLLYWPDSETVRFLRVTGPDTLENWRSVCGARYDQRSIIADPLFVDIANDDYRLAANSPAYDIGFKEIDQDLPGLDEEQYVLVNHLVAAPGEAAGEIALSWDPVSTASDYRVWRSTVSGKSFSLAGTTDTDAFVDKGLTADKPYFYKVNAVIDGLESPNSREASALPATRTN
jgi:hypothetical protein